MRHAFALFALAVLPSHAQAQPVPLPAFQSLQLRGGGEVIVRHGPVQRVTLFEGSTAVTRLQVDHPDARAGNTNVRDSGGRLVISACETRCPRNYKLRVEIVTPNLAGMAIDGGGRIAAQGAFPRQDALGLAVRGGGLIDARPLQAKAVGASVAGGGVINTHPVDSLGASVKGGGAIRYWGNPVLASSVSGGGAVTRAGGGGD